MNKLYITKIKEGIFLGIGITLFFSVLFGLIYAVGFHTPDEIISGIFLGNYRFNGSVDLGDNATYNGIELDNRYLTSFTETDPTIGSLTNGKWCTSDGTIINCVNNTPTSSICPVGYVSVTMGNVASCLINGVSISTNNAGNKGYARIFGGVLQTRAQLDTMFSCDSGWVNGQYASCTNVYGLSVSAKTGIGGLITTSTSGAIDTKFW